MNNYNFFCFTLSSIKVSRDQSLTLIFIKLISIIIKSKAFLTYIVSVQFCKTLFHIE